jgi:hypothetical protein
MRRWRPWLEVVVVGILGGFALLGGIHAALSWWLGYSMCPPTP